MPKLLAQQLTISYLLTSLTPKKDLTNILIGLYDINKHGLTSSKKEWAGDDIQNGPRILTLFARMFSSVFKCKKNCFHQDQFFQMRKALKDQQDVNLHLRSYIDNVLMNIMEKHPELLEIRSKK